MSLTALVGLSLGTAAMTVVLSAFGGLEELIVDQFQDANPDLKISPASGPTLALTAADSIFFQEVAQNYPQSKLAAVYKKRTLLTFGDNQHIAYLIGVDTSFYRTHRLSSHIITQADPALDLGNHTLSLGAGVAYHLGISSTNPPPVATVYLPRVTTETTLLNLSDAIEAENVFVESVFSVQPDFDQQYVIAPAAWVKKFTGMTAPSYLELHTSSPRELRKAFSGHFGERILLADPLQQEATLFKVMRSERLVVLAILSFVVLLASFGVVSALTIIALEKKNDIHTLWSMGASDRLLRAVFFKNGMLIVGSGWILGLTLGISLILTQQYIGIIPLGSGYVQEYYPVRLTIEHVLLTSGIVLTIGTVLSAWATRNVARKVGK